MSERATKAEMEERAAFLIDYAERHEPVSVRQLYYQAEVNHLPGIDKSENGYDKIQAQVLKLRRGGRLAYEHIADATRWMRKPRSHSSIADALMETARVYRRSLWQDARSYVEIWCEKDALAGVIFPVTAAYDVPLMVTRGYSSETFAFEAVAAREHDERDYHVIYLGDFDRAGVGAADALFEKLDRFWGEQAGSSEIVFETIAVTEEQVAEWRLSTREPKRNTPADRAWPHDFACELDAIEPDMLRDLVTDAIEEHLPRAELDRLKKIEQAEREAARGFVEEWAFNHELSSRLA